jgi:hypothetical protein
MISAILPVVLGVVLLSMCRAAYRRGCRRTRRVFPCGVVHELAEHKLACLGEPPARVDLELDLLLGVARATTPQETSVPRA